MKLKKDILLHTVAGEHMLVTIGALAKKETQLLRLNETGWIMAQRLQDGTTEDALALALVQTFGIEKSRASADVHRFIEGLASLSLLTD